MEQESPKKETKPSVALPIVHIDHAGFGPAKKKLASCPNPSARQALIVEYLLSYPSADIPEEVRAKPTTASPTIWTHGTSSTHMSRR